MWVILDWRVLLLLLRGSGLVVAAGGFLHNPRYFDFASLRDLIIRGLIKVRTYSYACIYHNATVSVSVSANVCVSVKVRMSVTVGVSVECERECKCRCKCKNA